MSDTPKLTWGEEYKLALQRCVPGSKWRNIKSGIAATVVSFDGWDVVLRRDKGRETKKWIHYFASEYEYIGGPNE